MDARNYDEFAELKSGTAVRIRSIRADDKGRLSDAFRNLDAESIYTRFFHHKAKLSDEELRTATEVDFDNVVALVVTIGSGESEVIIGGGRYAAFATPDRRLSAEVSFVSEEDYQGQGIASLLLRHLARIARQRGVSQFEAEVLSKNKGMLAVFSRSALPMTQHSDEGVVHVTLSLEG